MKVDRLGVIERVEIKIEFVDIDVLLRIFELRVEVLN
jgi:hypothetical protein